MTGLFVLLSVVLLAVERYKLWVDEASKLYGGLDLLALDAIVDEKGKEYILEVPCYMANR